MNLQSKEQQAFEAEQAARHATLEDKTSKNKAKRDKRKAAQQRAKAAKAVVSSASQTSTDLSKAAPISEEPAVKKRKTAPGAEAVKFMPHDSDED